MACLLAARKWRSGLSSAHLAMEVYILDPHARAAYLGAMTPQRFQLGHAGDTACLAVSPDGLLVATGEVSRRPNIIVWSAEGAEAVQVGHERRGPPRVKGKGHGEGRGSPVGAQFRDTQQIMERGNRGVESEVARCYCYS